MLENYIDDVAKIRRKMNQAWELAGLARQDGDNIDELKHSKEAARLAILLNSLNSKATGDIEMNGEELPKVSLVTVISGTTFKHKGKIYKKGVRDSIVDKDNTPHYYVHPLIRGDFQLKVIELLPADSVVIVEPTERVNG